MLVKLLPDQISRFWPYIKYALERSIPVAELKKTDNLNNILESLLFGVMQDWLCVDVETTTVLGNLVTGIFHEGSSKTKILRLYSLYGYDDLPEQEYRDGFHTMREFAHSQDCRMMDAFTDNPRIIEMAKMVGGEARLTYVTMEI